MIERACGSSGLVKVLMDHAKVLETEGSSIGPEVHLACLSTTTSFQNAISSVKAASKHFAWNEVIRREWSPP